MKGWKYRSKELLKPQIRIDRMVNKNTADYHPSPSQSISRIHPVIFLWTPKGFISPEFFLNFFLNLYIPPKLRKSFKFMVLILLANKYISDPKNRICSFLIMPQAKPSPRVLSLPPMQKEITHSFQTAFFEGLCFIYQKVVRITELTKLLKCSWIPPSLQPLHFWFCFIVP